MTRLIGQVAGAPDVARMLPLSCLSGNIAVVADSMQRFCARLPREETIALCAKLNLINTEAHYRNRKNAQEIILQLLLHNNWIDRPDFILMNRYVQRQAPGGFEDHRFAERINCIEFMRWLSIYGNRSEEGTMNDIARKRSFARGALLAFELWIKRVQTPVFVSPEFLDGTDEERSFLALRVFREQHLWQLPGLNPLWQCARSQELYLKEFLGSNPELQTLVERDLRLGVDDYVACIVGLSSLPFGWFEKETGIVDNFEFNPHTVSSTSVSMSGTFRRFLAIESHTSSSLEEGFKRLVRNANSLTDMRPLRERPIFLFSEGRRATLLDTSLLFERASTGLLFRAVGLCDVPEEALSKFGHSFELYSAKRLHRYAKSCDDRGSECKAFGDVKAIRRDGKEVQFSDFALICGRDLILFEIKGRWLQDKAIAGTAEEYWNEVRNKYVQDEKSGKRKGVSQLAEAIDRWTKRQLSPKLPIALEDIDTIIPVLLVCDRHLPTLFHGRYLAWEFQKLIPQSPEKLVPELLVNGRRVLNLCLLSIDELEEFENRIRRRALSQLAKDYSNKFPARDIALGPYLLSLAPEPFNPEPPIVAESAAVVDESCRKLLGRSLLRA